MRSLLLLAVAGTVFLVFVLRTHDRAEDLLAREAQALRTLRAGPEAPREEGGYRFEGAGGGALPEVVVARPVRHAEDGVRHFVRTRDGEVYEFDTVLHAAPGNRPDVQPLLLYLAVPAAERPDALRLFGWKRIE